MPVAGRAGGQVATTIAELFYHFPPARPMTYYSLPSKEYEAARRWLPRAASVIVACGVLAAATLLAPTTARAATGWLNVEPTATSTYSVSGRYVIQPVYIPSDLSGAAYFGLYLGDAACTVPSRSVYLFDWDIRGTTTMNGTSFLASRFASGASSAWGLGGSCLYQITTIRTGGSYPSGTLSATTTPVYIPAGYYWVVTTKNSNLRGETNPDITGFALTMDTLTTPWVQHYDYDLSRISVFIATSTSSIPPATDAPYTVEPVLNCSAIDLPCYLKSALVYVFKPGDASFDAWRSVAATATSTWPFSIALDAGNVVSDFLNAPATSSPALQVHWIGGTTTILSSTTLDVIPSYYRVLVRNIFGWAIYMFGAAVIFRLGMSALNPFH